MKKHGKEIKKKNPKILKIVKEKIVSRGKLYLTVLIVPFHSVLGMQA